MSRVFVIERPQRDGYTFLDICFDNNRGKGDRIALNEIGVNDCNVSTS